MDPSGFPLPFEALSFWTKNGVFHKYIRIDEREDVPGLKRKSRGIPHTQRRIIPPVPTEAERQEKREVDGTDFESIIAGTVDGRNPRQPPGMYETL